MLLMVSAVVLSTVFHIMSSTVVKDLNDLQGRLKLKNRLVTSVSAVEQLTTQVR